MTTDIIDDNLVIPTLRSQIGLPIDDIDGKYKAPVIDLSTYDKCVIACSTGKDSLACLLHLIDCDVPTEKIELWHHSVDGELANTPFMDWSFTHSYFIQLAKHFKVEYYFSYLSGGFKGEMLKANAYSKPHIIQTPDGDITLQRDKSRTAPSTRMRFPQMSASLSTRWCSSALKIDVGRRSFTNQTRFNSTKTLFITGERRDESPGRAKYNQFERHVCDRRDGKLKRHVDAWRPVLDFDEAAIWALIEKHRIIAPVPYRLGFPRSSCMCCIFNSPKIWSTINLHFPERIREISDYEQQFGTTISRSRKTVLELAQSHPPVTISDPQALEQATRRNYTLPLITPHGQRWQQPPGAFSTERCGAI